MTQYTVRNINDVFAIPENLLDEFIIDLKQQYKHWHKRKGEPLTRDVSMIFIPDGRHDNILGV